MKTKIFTLILFYIFLTLSINIFSQTTDDCLFIHHSVGGGLLGAGGLDGRVYHEHFIHIGLEVDSLGAYNILEELKAEGHLDDNNCVNPDFVECNSSFESWWLSESYTLEQLIDLETILIQIRDTTLENKDFIDERNDIFYGTVISPNPGRPSSLGAVPGDNTNMADWLFWFNDYLEAVKTEGCSTGENRIIMFKSCYTSAIYGLGSEPGNPFNNGSLTNYQAVFRHPSGSGNTYTHSNGYTYSPLEDIFANNPNTLFIFLTIPTVSYTSGRYNVTNEGYKRDYHNWLINDWLPSYNAANPGLNNVAIFDLFDVLAYPPDHQSYPNGLR
ncbi:hypothetical protein BVX93_00600, partial [bacterium B13(2017)]